jgi:metal-responsive CopG/Arc/MetJ family transcriptional regulator
MAKPGTKIAVSIPAPLYEALERARRESHKSRSAIVQEALREWLRRGLHQQLVRDYEAGYRTQRETPAEVEAALATALGLIPKDEEW